MSPKFTITRTRATSKTCEAVVNFPRILGDILRSPVRIYMPRFPVIRIISLLITIIVSHVGIHPRIVRVIKEETSSALSATGSSKAPRLVFCLFNLASSPSRRSVTPAIAKIARE